MAYKQSPFPKHLNVLSKSPSLQSGSTNRHGDPNTYLTNMALGAQYGFKYGGALGAVIGTAGAAAGTFLIHGDYNNDGDMSVSQGASASDLKYMKQHQAYEDWVGGGAKAHRDKIQAEKKAAQDKINKENQIKTSYVGDNKTVNAVQMGDAKLRLAKHFNPDKKENPNDWNTFKSKSSHQSASAFAQLSGRASRPDQSNQLNPIVNPFNTTQNELNGEDETNLAVQYNRFNNIAQNLDTSI